MSDVTQQRGAAASPPRIPGNQTAALRLAEAGIPVLPVGSNKAPLIKDWPSRSVREVSQVLAFWHRHPDALPGIDCGAAGLLVVDADRRGPIDGVAAFERLAEREGFDLSVVPIVVTPSHGKHYFFRNRAERPFGNSAGGLPQGIDIRGAGGMVVGLGAKLPDGRRYMQQEGSPNLCMAFAQAYVPDVPPWLCRLIDHRARGSGPLRRPAEVVVLKSRVVAPGAIVATTVSTKGTMEKRGKGAAKAALLEHAQQVMSAQPGNRNKTLNAAAFRMGRFAAAGWITPKAIESALLEASTVCGLIRDHGVDAVMATLRSGLSAGLKEGAPVLKDRVRREAVPFDAAASEKFEWHRAIMMTGRYSPTVYRLAGLMLHYYRGDGRYVEASARFFKERLGVDRGTVVRALDVLENEGWLIPAGRSRARAPLFRLGKPVSQE